MSEPVKEIHITKCENGFILRVVPVCAAQEWWIASTPDFLAPLVQSLAERRSDTP